MIKDRLTTRERMRRMFAHQDADRVPVVDAPWASTIERWKHEGLPENGDYEAYLGMDRVRLIMADNSPRFPEDVIEETEAYIVHKSRWGAIKKDWKHAASTPQHLDFVVKDRDSWEKAKERMQPDPARIPWDMLRTHYKGWREAGDWISAGFWFGFEVTYSHMIGVPFFIAMAEDPEWVKDIVTTMLDLSIALYDMVWEAGYTFDQVNWWNDMGYKGTSFMSPKMYRELFKPADRKAAEWAHRHGCVVHYHSCGNVSQLVPDLIDAGVDMLNPLEVKAGMDPLALKATYGKSLAFHGGLNAMCYEPPEAMWAEMQRVIPVMMSDGGYVAATDHSIPDSVSLKQYQRFVELAKEIGRY
jgi:uroporphyrinogen decarboxylase